MVKYNDIDNPQMRLKIKVSFLMKINGEDEDDEEDDDVASVHLDITW